MSRADQLRQFLARAGRAGWQRRPLAGDASARRYERLTQDGESLILMDADPALCGPQTAFLHIRSHLEQLGFSVPALVAAEETAGFLLLEDFGDALFARVIAEQPAREPALYRCAADLLARLQQAPLPPAWRR